MKNSSILHANNTEMIERIIMSLTIGVLYVLHYHSISTISIVKNYIIFLKIILTLIF